MATIIGFETNLQNVWYLSPCSIASIKTTLFKNITTGLFNAAGTCLQNVPTNLPIENTYFNTFLPGQLWDVEQQCKISFDNPNSGAAVCGVKFRFFFICNLKLNSYPVNSFIQMKCVQHFFVFLATCVMQLMVSKTEIYLR
jgi:hypothetical protein